MYDASYTGVSFLEKPSTLKTQQSKNKKDNVLQLLFSNVLYKEHHCTNYVPVYFNLNIKRHIHLQYY